MSRDSVLNRFVQHLSLNPYVVTRTGAKEMLADRPLAKMLSIELNAVLVRYVAVAVAPGALAGLPLPPTIAICPACGVTMDCLWELAEPVTATRNGRPGVISFFNDVGKMIADMATQRAEPRGAAARVLQGMVHSPLNGLHDVTVTDKVFTLAELRRTFHVRGNCWSRAKGDGSFQHHRSGTDWQEFDALRHAAPGLCVGATSVQELVVRLEQWATSAPELKSSTIPSQALSRLSERVAEYTFARRRGRVASDTRHTVETATSEVASEFRVSLSAARLHLQKLIAAKAGVSERTVRRTIDS